MGAEHSDSVAISVCEPAIGDERRAETGLSLSVDMRNQASRMAIWTTHGKPNCVVASATVEKLQY